MHGVVDTHAQQVLKVLFQNVKAPFHHVGFFI